VCVVCVVCVCVYVCMCVCVRARVPKQSSNGVVVQPSLNCRAGMHVTAYVAQVKKPKKRVTWFLAAETWATETQETDFLLKYGPHRHTR